MTPAVAKYFCTPEIYDLTYSDLVQDIAPIVAEARATGGPLLEGCCGNGRVLIPLLEAGVDADGFDLDPDMLADLNKKLAARGLRAQVHHADMRDFALERRYRMILIPFNSFLHNLTQEDQLATLRRCREHLQDGGHLTLILFHPSVHKLVEYNGGQRKVREHPNASGAGTVRVSDAISTDRVEQINTCRRTVEEIDPDGHVTTTHEFHFQVRYIWKPEMELLFRVTGFGRWQARSFMKNATLENPGTIEEGDILAWSAWKS
jgi:hypothetical protein